MTHKDIYIKFMIEYDKANVTSSYPSLTEYEVATVLDKAYNALIAQKVTGNNFRRSTFESDVKAIADLQPLITYAVLDEETNVNPNVSTQFGGLDTSISSNTHVYDLEKAENFLYYLQCYVAKKNKQIDEEGKLTDAYSYLKKDANGYITVDSSNPELFLLPIKLLNHELANQFFTTGHNVPWVKDPICYLENNSLVVVADGYDKPTTDKVQLVYIKKPNLFVKSDQELQNAIEIGRSEFISDVTISRNGEGDIQNYRTQAGIDEVLSRYEDAAATDETTVFAINESTGEITKYTKQDLESATLSDGAMKVNGEYMYYVKNSNISSQVYPNLDMKFEDLSSFDSSGNATAKLYATSTFEADAGQFSITRYKENSSNNAINDVTYLYDRYLFELNDTMAEELISLAIAFALENVESPRLNSRLNMRGLEA